jgi:hypothetical protein
MSVNSWFDYLQKKAKNLATLPTFAEQSKVALE